MRPNLFMVLSRNLPDSSSLGSPNFPTSYAGSGCRYSEFRLTWWFWNFYVTGPSKPQASKMLLQDRSSTLYHQALPCWGRVYKSRYYDSAQYNHRCWNRKSYKDFRTSGKDTLCLQPIIWGTQMLCFHLSHSVFTNPDNGNRPAWPLNKKRS